MWLLSGKESAHQCRRHKRCKFNPWVRNPLEDKSVNTLRYPSLGNPMDRRAWQATVYGAAAKSQTWLSMHAYMNRKHSLSMVPLWLQGRVYHWNSLMMPALREVRLSTGDGQSNPAPTRERYENFLSYHIYQITLSDFFGLYDSDLNLSSYFLDIFKVGIINL